jgi:Holliday junction resolvase RusA-like endonuclease
VRQQHAHPLDGGPFALYLEFTHGDRVRRDSDNGVSSILDLLVDCGVLQDDNWMVVSKIVTTNLYDKGNPGVQISIIPLTDAEKLSRL